MPHPFQTGRELESVGRLVNVVVGLSVVAGRFVVIMGALFSSTKINFGPLKRVERSVLVVRSSSPMFVDGLYKTVGSFFLPQMGRSSIAGDVELRVKVELMVIVAEVLAVVGRLVVVFLVVDFEADV